MNDRSVSRESRWVWVVAAALAALWARLAGKDMGWDLLNHQLYLPFSLLSGRFATDLLAAGPQSTQNPIGYLPFYALATSPLPGWLVGALMAAATTAPAALALHAMARRLFGDDTQARDWRLVAVAAGLLAPVHLLVAGGAATDPWCAALLLLALASVLDTGPRRLALVGAGAACGLAVAIKPTSIVFAVPAAAVVGLQIAIGQRSWRDLAWGLVSALAVFALAGGLWAAWLWSEFGSPTYPLLNQWFHSPLAPDGPTVALRFLPATALDWVTRPFAMAQYKAFVSVEAFAPDLRPAAALLLGLALLAWRLVRRRAIAPASDAAFQLTLFALLAYPLWMATSGNARYGLALFMVVGLLLVRAAWALRPARPVLLVLAAGLGLQTAAYVGQGDRRLDGQAWNDLPYAPFEVPDRLRNEPVLHLSLGVQSHAGLAPWLHPGGAFVSLNGQMSLPVDGPLGERLQRRLQAWEGRTRVLFAPRFAPGTPRFERAVEGDSWLLENRFGLRIDTSDCETARIRTPPDSKRPRLLSSCRAVPSERRDPAFAAKLAEADRVFALLEANCPRIYGPRPFVSDANPGAIWRRYMNSDTVIEISPIDGVLVTHHRAPNPIYLGRPEQVVENQGKEGCTAWNKLTAQQ